MNSDLSHLPEAHRADLARLVELIRSEVDDVEIIILFGSFARGDWKTESDLPPPEERRSGHASDYDILVVTDSGFTDNSLTGSDPTIWQGLSHRSLSMGLQTHARIIGYDFRTINERLTEGRYFYVDIVREGIVLYTTGRKTLAKPQHVPEGKRREVAEKHLRAGIDNAETYFDIHEYCCRKEKYKQAAFNLNQATEAAYKTILLVFTNHSPHEHWLKTLGDDAAMHAPCVAGIFPKETKDDEWRFMQLDEAYIAARYDPNFTMSREDLEVLAKSVRELLDRTKAVCEVELGKMG